MPQYMIQTHDATNLHTDFRLEFPDEGVYKSWAVPKGLPTTPGDIRLAVPTPDHPMEYMLEGNIPEGEYGAGTVLLWDRGEWTAKDLPEEDKINFYLEGARMEGYWTLLRPKGSKDWIVHCISAGDQFGDTNRSVLSGRTLEEIALNLPFKPQLSKLVEKLPTGAEWVYEPKHDGYRCLAHRDNGVVRLYSRSGQDWTNKYPYIVKVLTEKNWEGWIDGELAVLSKDGTTSFQDLQNANPASRQVTYLVFDRPDMDQTSLAERKAYLHSAFKHSKAIKVVDYKKKPFDPCSLGLEGAIAKKVNCPYTPGNKDCWQKVKCNSSQELAVGGYIEGKGKKKNQIGSLLVGYYEDGNFKYAGKVSASISHDRGIDLLHRLQTMEQDTSPFVDGPTRGSWVRPQVVVDTKFLGWTDAGRIRQGVMGGIREDKPPFEVVREVPGITHPDKVLFPGAGLTKQGLADYYDQVADKMIPEIKNRPLTLLRCPDGVDKKCFFQRNASSGRVPVGLKIVELNGNKHYVLADKRGLASLAQLNVAEIHPWNIRMDKPDNPDRLIFDLDPSEGVPWEQTVECAQRLKTKLEANKLKVFVKVTGSKGVHLVVPIKPSRTVTEVREYAREIAEQLSTEYPDLYTSSPGARARKGRIYIDWLRNDLGSTSIAPWSTRAQSNAPVAVPIEWESLSKTLPDSVSTKTASALSDAWRNIARSSSVLNLFFGG